MRRRQRQSKNATFLLGRYEVREVASGKKRRFCVMDTVTGRWVNIIWTERDHAIDYCNGLNARVTSRPGTVLA